MASENSEHVKRWRARTKARMISAMGGQCAVCHYSRCPDALEFHHLDPSQKDLKLGGARANPTAWAKVVVELRKCILLCSICHREYHAGLVESLPTPTGDSWFDESYACKKRVEAEYREVRSILRHDPCPVCDKPKPAQYKTCSHSCAAKKNSKIDWDTIDLPTLRQTMNYSELARMLGCSDVAVRKREKKLLKNIAASPALSGPLPGEE
jgi:hypothetical protein